MFPFGVLLIGLTLVTCLSPLLTFVALFQQKEWRTDRLNEHLRRDGFSQLFGSIRPIILAASIMLMVLPFSFTQTATFLLLVQAVFATLTLIQFALRKQRMPRWTNKAILITTFSLFITFCAIDYAYRFLPSLILILVVLQPLMVLLTWSLLKPLDFFLKSRVMNKARDLRASWKDATVIGIAGSVGKTTTKELINHLLQDLNPTTTPAHVNTEMGVAQWIINNHYKLQTTNYKLMIVEMGAYRKGEIKLLSDIAQPTIGVMTALGSDHLALFGSEQAIIEANGELIEALPKDGHAFFYGENDGCRELAKKALCDVTLTTDLKSINQFEMPLQGAHNVHNVYLAVAVARHFKIADKRIAELLKSFRQTAHTFDVKTESGVLVLDDTYNISPLSFKAALDWAVEQKQRPRVLLTSGLQETGSKEDRFLKELGAQAKDAVERVVFTNKHGADIFSSAFGKDVEILSSSTKKVEAGSVLVCVGRMPLSTITRLLPND